ncbi:ankyrin repeat and SOCS box protein 13-like [Dreissena polymorpha]|uniref:SOCS box domain-containing protein n=1 Tax=Dreissena polymorpha TaxID=45954 RepID=A0A9D4M4N4_DREPO|nr:ankyrin repeat and SOCS box protein 13-like [Dreissena polymorpha]KAH3869553.1 hypothetical protein DPMN_032722 [Dreissena polymorpha]
MEEFKIFEAASANNIEYVREALAGEHGSVDSEDVGLALIRAATNGHEECVRLLLNHSANVNATNGAEDTALSTAAESGHFSIVRLVLDKGCDLNHQNASGYTALMKACENGHVEVVDFLLKSGAKDVSEDVSEEHAGVPNGVPRLPKYMPHGYSSLMVTVLKQPEHFKKILRLLLDDGMNVNEIDLQDMTVLHHAANKCTEDVIEMLLEAGAKVNTKDVWGVTPLMSAAAYCKINNVKIMLKYGADVSLFCKAKRTALSIAARTGSGELIQTLLEAGADPNFKNAHGHTPVFIALVHNNYAGVKCLIQAGCDLETPCRDLSSLQPMSCCQYALHRKNVKLLKMLYLAGAFTYKTLYEAALDQQLKHDSSDNPDFFHELNTLALNPRSLRHTCRIFINKNLGARFPKCLPKLALPTPLFDFLCYSDMNSYTD